MNSKETDILNSALELFVSKGFHGSATSVIAEGAGVSNGTLFHYFKSKEVLIQKLHEVLKSEQIEAIIKGLEEVDNPKDQIQLIWKQSISWSMKNEKANRFLHQYKYSPYRRKHGSDVTAFRNKFAGIVEKGIQQKLLTYNPADFIFDITSAHVYGMVEYLQENPIKFRTPEFMKQAFETYWSSVKA